MDRELLEKAARAAGIDFNDKRSPTGSDALYCGPGVGWWNPLTDDGDALRLAVSLKITVMQPEEGDRDEVGGWAGSFYKWVSRSPDPYASTRRAIVRAAAAIGEGKESKG